MMVTETLALERFAGINKAEIELNRVNIFIGPQASGKSVCAKLLYFFKGIIRRLAVEVDEGRTKTQIKANQKDLFLKYFPASNWNSGTFWIKYSFGKLEVRIERKATDSATIDIYYSAYYDELLAAARKAHKKAIANESIEELKLDSVEATRQALLTKLSAETGKVLANQNFFIPAGRSFFSTIRSSVFSFIAGDVGLDPFLVEFGRLYQNIRRVPSNTIINNRNPNRRVDNKRIDEHIKHLICGTYKRSRNNDYIVTDDGRQVAVESSSSGQQEALPLALLLVRMAKTSAGINRSTFFVEEPEAHLYPDAQREIVHLLSAVTDLSSTTWSSQYIITTHSPYILAAFNNLMFGDQIAKKFPEKYAEVYEILENASPIAAANVRAYSFDGGVHSIIDAETGLVKASSLDSVSTKLAKEFDKLVDIMLKDDFS